MKRALVLLVGIAALAGCGGVHSSSPPAYVPRDIAQAGPMQRHGRGAPQLPSAAEDPVSYAEKVAGVNRFFAGVVDDPGRGTVRLNLVHAPQSIIDRIRAAYPDTFTINNDATRTWGFVLRLQRTIHGFDWRASGVHIVESWPDQHGSLHVGVTSNVAKAQALFDAKYGPGVVRVAPAEPGVMLGTR